MSSSLSKNETLINHGPGVVRLSTKPKFKIMKITTVSCLIVGLFSGCASFEPQTISPAGTVARYESRTLDNPDLHAFIQKNSQREVVSWPLPQWDFDLLTLAAFYYHPDLDVARAKWGVAQAGLSTAGMRPNPSINLNTQRNTDAPSATSPWTVGLNLDIPIETAGKRGYRIDRAHYLSEAARLAIAGTAWQVRSRVRSTLLDLYFAQQTQTVLLQQQTLQQNNVVLLEHRLALGMASQPEITQARIALNQTALAFNETLKLQAEARAKLASALGVSSKAIESISISSDIFTSIPELPTMEVRQQALLSRPDILSALAEYAASQSALQLEIARQYPDLHLGPGYSWDAGARKWALGLSLVLPIFNQNQGPIAEAKALRLQAMSAFNASQARAIGEIDASLANYRAIQSKLAAADTLLAAQNKQIRNAMASFKAGQTDKVALLGSQLEMSQIAISRIDVLAKTQQALGALEDAVQRPLIAPALLPDAVQDNPRQTKENNQ